MSHRGLVLSETALIVGLLQMHLRDLALDTDLVPPWARVLIGMGLVVGLFGFFLRAVDRRSAQLVKKTHKTASKLPIQPPQLLVHLAVLAALFFAYAHYWDARTGALAALWRLRP